MGSSRLLLATIVATVTSVACATPAAERSDTPAPAVAEHETHWGYDGESGPEHWGSLNDDFRLCEEGDEQSPVDIASTRTADLPPIEFSYRPSALHMLNNGHTIHVDYDRGSSISIEGKRFRLVQFHFHAASEHTIEGRSSPLELHLVHQAADEELAVVGVLIEEGADNASYSTVFENLPDAKSEETTTSHLKVDAADLLPTGTSYFRYDGSLTTPPCAEGVRWHVMTEPVELSSAQIDAFTRIYDHNNRPVQPLGEREILRSSD